MPSSDLFLDSYSQIERHLRSTLGADRDVPFSRLVDLAAARFPAVRCYATDLREFSDLRNAIVHERTDGHVIAEPLERTVSQLRQIAQVLLHPPSVGQFAHRPVVTVAPSDPLAKAVSLMSRHSYSQLPVVGPEGCESVLTANAITRWLGASQAVGIVSIDETSVREVLCSREATEVHRFLPRTAAVFEVIEAFQEEDSRGHLLAAILVSQNGRPNQSLLGIVTLSDLPAAYGLISARSAGGAT